jgi:hypothetical protein
MPQMQCNGVGELYDSTVDYLKVGVFPGWFRGWPAKEAAATRLRRDGHARRGSALDTQRAPRRPPRFVGFGSRPDRDSFPGAGCLAVGYMAR